MTTINRFLSVSLAALATSIVFGAEVVYQNDFSTRTSKKPVPSGEWVEKPYAAPAALFYSYSRASGYTQDLPYGNVSRVQDGWVRLLGPDGDCEGVNFWTRDPGNGNPVAAFSNSSGTRAQARKAYAVHPLFNEFSDGVLRVTVDIRPPDDWAKSSMLRIVPLFRDKLVASKDSFGSPYALAFGIQNDGSRSAPSLNLSVYGRTSETDTTAKSNTAKAAKVGDGDGEIRPGHWYRLVAEMNIDESSYNFFVFDMGTVQPTLATPTPDVTQHFGEYFVSGEDPITHVVHGKKWMYRSVTAETGPICGLGFRMEGAGAYAIDSDNKLVINNAPQIDNVKVGWKRPGSDAFESCYENDFSVCRRRTISGSSASFDYTTALAKPESESYSYPSPVAKDADNSVLVKPALCRANVDTTSIPGRDGWIVTACESTEKIKTPLNALVSSAENGGTVLAFVKSTDGSSSSAAYVRMAQPIGKAFTSGKVIVQADLKTSGKWNGDSRTQSICLGPDGLATKSQTIGARFGVAAPTNDKEADREKVCPYISGRDPNKDTGVELKLNTWYRMVTEIDLDVKKWSYSLYEMGATAPAFSDPTPAEAVASYEGQSYTADSLSQIGVVAYGFGKSYSTGEAFDNLRVSEIVGGQTNLVYSNTFSTRKRYGAAATESVALVGDELNVPNGGVDNWLRRGAGTQTDGKNKIYGGLFTVRDVDGDPAVSFDDEKDLAYAMHSFGRNVKRGNLTFSVDMRPPLRCTEAHVGRVTVGGEEFAQGEVGVIEGANGVTIRQFTDAFAGQFGFAKGTTDEDEIGFVNTFRLTYNDGTARYLDYDISKDARKNWYRFVAKFDLERQKWSLSVYDQGTERPQLDSALGNLVATQEDIAFKYADPKGLSAFTLSAKGSSGYKYLEEDTGGLLIDNIRITRNPQRLAIILR